MDTICRLSIAFITLFGSYIKWQVSKVCYMGVCGAMSPEKLQKEKNFDEKNSDLQKNGNLIQTKKAPRWKGFWGLRFFMHPFPNVYKAIGNSIDP